MSSFFRGDYVSSKEASEKLGVHFQTLRNWDREGKIKTIRSPGGKRFYDIKSFTTEVKEDYKICEINILKLWIMEKYKI